MNKLETSSRRWSWSVSRVNSFQHDACRELYIRCIVTALQCDDGPLLEFGGDCLILIYWWWCYDRTRKASVRGSSLNLRAWNLMSIKGKCLEAYTGRRRWSGTCRWTDFDSLIVRNGFHWTEDSNGMTDGGLRRAELSGNTLATVVAADPSMRNGWS